MRRFNWADFVVAMVVATMFWGAAYAWVAITTQDGPPDVGRVALVLAFAAMIEALRKGDA